ncbi:Aste57867_3741 [Aphanomyces stellatus]|uniref:Aste57867_3741 protein n=1 Tax=Aphanomyces stellatus TaxID=120398 RepID=A0A485KEP8_9STRA|nr:hypothetical protein As57867_003730 [Aphanomyces stellatus]VFT80894.1 Aste57867_3741 [Aphanomyces stellatus]
MALVSVAEYFHSCMRFVCAKQDWATVVAMGNRGLGTTVLRVGSLVETPALFNLPTSNNSIGIATGGVIWNCIASVHFREQELTEMYVANFTLQLIQDSLVAHNLYHASPIMAADPTILVRAMTVFSNPAPIGSYLVCCGLLQLRRSTDVALWKTHDRVGDVHSGAQA